MGKFFSKGRPMSKTILTEVDGFTPLPDMLVNRYGIVTAAVWGRMWRYCQMENGVCQATLETIGRELNLDKSTILRHAETLVADGFFIDKTPDLRNRPHTYVDTGKVAMYNRFGVGVAQNNVTVAHSNVGVAENQLKIGIKIDSKRDGADAPNFSEPLPVDWQIATDQKSIVLPSQDQEWQAKVDIALMGICRYGADLEGLARAFIDGRRILPSKRELKGWATAFREMKTAGVGANDIIQALGKLNDAGLTIADPWGVKKTAIAMAIKSPFEQQQEVIW